MSKTKKLHWDLDDHLAKPIQLLTNKRGYEANEEPEIDSNQAGITKFDLNCLSNDPPIDNAYLIESTKEIHDAYQDQ